MYYILLNILNYRDIFILDERYINVLVNIEFRSALVEERVNILYGIEYCFLEIRYGLECILYLVR